MRAATSGAKLGVGGTEDVAWIVGGEGRVSW